MSDRALSDEPMSDQPLRIERRPFDHPDAVDLIEQLQHVYVRLYGNRDEDSTDPAQFTLPAGLFLVGYRGGPPVASGGWRRVGERAAEIKRMFVVESARGAGVARRMLAELERSAAAEGVERMLLNTGFRQVEAIALYESSGYRRTDVRFGHYADTKGAFFFAKTLPSGASDPIGLG